MTTPGAHQQTAELAQRMVARIAAHEMPIFRAASRAYFDNPERALGRRSGDEMLGFGTDSMAALTPYALVVADTVVGRLTEELGPDWTGALGADQLEMAGLLARDKALELQLEEETARLLADALVAALGAPPS